MKIRVLGAHKLENRDVRHTCFLIDSILGLDAGSLASAMTPSEQAQVQAVLVTHSHFDHIRDIPTLGVSTLDVPKTIDLYSLSETWDAIYEHLLNWEVYPDLTKSLNSGPPKFRFHAVQPGVPFRVLGYEIKPIQVPHPVPCIGFIVRSDSGGCIAYTGDTASTVLPFFQNTPAPYAVFVDVSFPNRLTELARLTGHLTPWMLREQLLVALETKLSLPRIVGVHLSPDHQGELDSELGVLATELGVDLMLGYAGMQLEV